MLLTTLVEYFRHKRASNKDRSLFEAAVAREEQERQRLSARVQFPHCDSLILHAPGECEFCDQHPDWQELRKLQGIAFTGSPEELGTDTLMPCPSTYTRDPKVRDLWLGNRKV